MFDMTSTCLPRFLITEYFSVEKTQYRFPLIASYLPLPGQYKRVSLLLDRTLSQKFDDWGRFRRTFSQITTFSAELGVNTTVALLRLIFTSTETRKEAVLLTYRRGIPA